MSEIRVIYKPEGGSRRAWEIDLQNPLWELHKMAPKAAGFRGWVPFAQALEDVDADAWQAVVWVMRKRDGEPNLRYESVEFPSGLLNELDFAGKCPTCDEWVGEGSDSTSHQCVTSEPEDADPEA